jgi:hypothetical protein
MKLPLPRYNYEYLKSNIYYGQLQAMTFEELSKWVDELRKELLDRWDSGYPPYIGSDEEWLKENFSKLHNIRLNEDQEDIDPKSMNTIEGLQHQFFWEDELYPDYIGFIKNFTKTANGVNQFFPDLLKSKINNKSIYEYLSNDDLYKEFKHTIVQKVRFDKMYLYSSYLDKKTKFRTKKVTYIKQIFLQGDNTPPATTIPETYTESVSDDETWTDENAWKNFLGIMSVDKRYDFWFEDYEFNQKNDEKSRVRLPSSLVEKYLEQPINPSYNEDYETKKKMVSKRGYNRIGFNLEGTEKYYTIREYNRGTKVFPKIFQILRIGLNQVAVNFPPLTARWIYEKYLGELIEKLSGADSEQEIYKVYDPCAGWGGRLLGALCSNIPIHYIGTEVNQSNKEGYEELGKYYNELDKIVKYKKHKNTWEIHMKSSADDWIDEDFAPEHHFDVDLVFTSPPYFDKERYSEDKEQSCIQHPEYEEWLSYFLEQTLANCWCLLKEDRYCLINICDIKKGNTHIPLEQDTIQRAMSVGFKYEGKYGMAMTRMIGVQPTNSKNYWFDSKSKTTYKIEPILVFYKPFRKTDPEELPF